MNLKARIGVLAATVATVAAVAAPAQAAPNGATYVPTSQYIGEPEHLSPSNHPWSSASVVDPGGKVQFPDLNPF